MTMVKNVFLCLAPVAVLAACQPTVPNSAAGVGFGNYQEYMAAREAELQGVGSGSVASPDGSPLGATHGPSYGGAGYGASVADPSTGQPMSAMGGQPMPGQSMPGQAMPGQPLPGQPLNEAQSLGADTLAALNATAPQGSTPLQSAPQPQVPMQPVPQPVPQQAQPAQSGGGSGGPNIVAYALSATNQPGQSIYPRGGIKLSSSERACAKFVSPDRAQIAFLERGGPQRDPGNLDPDGDGFACGWDPRPFQAAR